MNEQNKAAEDLVGGSIELRLYTTLGCHLCEQALAIVEPLLAGGVFRLQTVEIADSEVLIRAYGVRIPVFARADTGEELAWPFDAKQARVFLEF
jgi:hypothetical protein